MWIEKMRYREELKYIVEEHTLAILGARLAAVMDVDRHQEGESYRVRSLYFDDYDNSALNENEAGVDNRKKFRIRAYNNLSKTINLEIKYKYRGKARKDSCPLTVQQVGDILNNRLQFDAAFPDPLLKLYVEMQSSILRPTLIVEYERSAFTYPLGNVRVTFDRHITYSKDAMHFLSEDILLTPLLPLNQHVLEVKYDEFLPDYIAQLMTMGILERSAFSKYYLARVTEQGGRIYE